MRYLKDRRCPISSGVWLKCDHAASGSVLVTAKLLGTSSDISAIRKVSGHLGIHATLGCHKCMKTFGKIDKRTDFSGFDFENWTLPTNSDHRITAIELYNATTRKVRQGIESATGVRHSTLLELDYRIRLLHTFTER